MPYRLLTGYGLWHLLAFDLGRDDWRTFRVRWIERPVTVRLRFDPRPLPLDDVIAHLRRR
jgi:predicted DNA-binding transcriptional regulator YafY